jgi:hypothetical protein
MLFDVINKAYCLTIDTPDFDPDVPPYIFQSVRTGRSVSITATVSVAVSFSEG